MLPKFPRLYTWSVLASYELFRWGYMSSSYRPQILLGLSGVYPTRFELELFYVWIISFASSTAYAQLGHFSLWANLLALFWFLTPRCILLGLPGDAFNSALFALTSRVASQLLARISSGYCSDRQPNEIGTLPFIFSKLLSSLSFYSRSARALPLCFDFDSERSLSFLLYDAFFARFWIMYLDPALIVVCCSPIGSSEILASIRCDLVFEVAPSDSTEERTSCFATSCLTKDSSFSQTIFQYISVSGQSSISFFAMFISAESRARWALPISSCI